MIEQKNNLIWAMEKKEPLVRVKNFFRDYDVAYKLLRNPSDKHYQDYKKLYFKYVEYEKNAKLEGNLK